MWKIRYLDPATGELTEATHVGLLSEAIEMFGEHAIMVIQRVPGAATPRETATGAETVQVDKA